MKTMDPPRLTSIYAEANRIAPGRRKSSDGTLGDRAHQAEVSDHNPDGRGIVHAIDISQSMPGSPYWEPHYQQFNIFAQFRRIVHDYQVASPADRVRRWGWLKYLVWFEASIGCEAIFDPEVSLSIRPNGHFKIGHTEHGHISIRHTVSAEQNTQPIFSGTSFPVGGEEDEVTDQDKKDIVAAVIAGLGGVKDGKAYGPLATVVKHYIQPTVDVMAQRMMTIDSHDMATGVLPVALKRYRDDPIFIDTLAAAIAAKLSS